MNISIIGTGNLGLSIAEGILSSHEIDLDTLYLTKRHPKNLQEKFRSNEKVVATADNHLAVAASEVVILAVQPGQLSALLETLHDDLDPQKHLIISTITGKQIKDFDAYLGRGFSIIRSMPNTAAAVGESMTCIASNAAGESKIDIAKSILSSLGQVMAIEESLMQAATVVCASGIAFWMRLIRATTQGAIQLGFDAPEAQNMAVQTCLGAASLLQQAEVKVFCLIQKPVNGFLR